MTAVLIAALLPIGAFIGGAIGFIFLTWLDWKLNRD